jgi:hypothetical protein
MTFSADDNEDSGRQESSFNPFAAFGEALAPTRKPRRTREAKPREKALQERECLSEAHRRWRKEGVAALLTGPHGAAARALLDFLDRMQPDNEHDLIELVQSGPWRDADADTRFLILALVDAAIIRLRERDDLVPFDDPIDAEESTFLIIRKMLQ